MRETRDLEGVIEAMPVFAKELIAGGVAGGFAKTVVAPLERVKILFQTRRSEFHSIGLFGSFKKIARTEGILGFYRGNGASVARIVPYAALHYMAYEQYRRWIIQTFPNVGRGPVLDLMAGSFAGGTAVLFTYPLDLVRTKLAYQVVGSSNLNVKGIVHSEQVYKGIMDCFLRTYKEAGLRGLYRGVAPSLYGIFPYAGLKFYFYEEMKSHVPDKHKKDITVKLVCGSIAGLLGQTFTYPLDVVRRQMQVERLLASNSKEMKGTMESLRMIVQNQGWKHLFTGLSINYLKVVPSVAIGFTVYDVVKAYLRVPSRDEAVVELSPGNLRQYLDRVVTITAYSQILDDSKRRPSWSTYQTISHCQSLTMVHQGLFFRHFINVVENVSRISSFSTQEDKMEIPVIDLSEIEGDKRSETMALLHQACEKSGFFQIDNHGIDKQVMENVKQLMNQHYEKNLKKSFYNSEIAKSLESGSVTSNADWESTFFIWHRPISNITEVENISDELRKAMDLYIDQLIKLAEKLSELMCENLGLEKDYIKKAFSGKKGPSIGTKVAIYPQCPRPELIRGLREHTDAGGIILLLQDDQVPGLEFFRGGQWVKIPPSKNNTIFVNTGDQIEVLSNGTYKSILHRVMAEKNGNRLSVATFYNPTGDAIISPAPKLLYPENYRFEDYLKLYGTNKFGNKGQRFEFMKKMP